MLETLLVRISQFPPSILVASGDEALRTALSRELRDRGCDVLEVCDAATFHSMLLEGTHCDVFVLDSLHGCSPFHGFAYARRHGLQAPAIAVVRLDDEHAQTEARRLDLILAPRATVFGSLDRLLETALRRVTRRDSQAA